MRRAGGGHGAVGEVEPAPVPGAALVPVATLAAAGAEVLKQWSKQKQAGGAREGRAALRAAAATSGAAVPRQWAKLEPSDLGDAGAARVQAQVPPTVPRPWPATRQSLAERLPPHAVQHDLAELREVLRSAALPGGGAQPGWEALGAQRIGLQEPHQHLETAASLQSRGAADLRNWRRQHESKVEVQLPRQGDVGAGALSEEVHQLERPWGSSASAPRAAAWAAEGGPAADLADLRTPLRTVEHSRWHRALRLMGAGLNGTQLGLAPTGAALATSSQGAGELAEWERRQLHSASHVTFPAAAAQLIVAAPAVPVLRPDWARPKENIKDDIAGLQSAAKEAALASFHGELQGMAAGGGEASSAAAASRPSGAAAAAGAEELLRWRRQHQQARL